MNATGVFAALTAVGLVTGPAIGATSVGTGDGTDILHAHIALTSDTAIFVGPTVLSTPSATFAETAAHLYLQPLGFDAGVDPATCVIGHGDCDAPLQVLSTPSLIQQGHSSYVEAYQIVEAVEAELAANPDAYDADHPLWIFGYSQGATAGSIAMAQLAHDGVDQDALHFVFIGDPSAATGAWPNAADGVSGINSSDAWMLFGNQTPDDAFPTTIYSIPGDPVADHTAPQLGLLYEHMMYLGLTPDQIADHTVDTDGMITSIDISGDFNQFGAWLNAWDHGLIDSGWWEGLFYSAVAAVYDMFGDLPGFFDDWFGVDWSDVENTLDVFFPMEPPAL